MSESSLANLTAWDSTVPNSPPDQRWLTTGDVAKMLQLSTEGVRELVRVGRLACEWTVSGVRIFRQGLVMRLVEQRATERIRSRSAMLRAVRPQMLRVGIEPRQLSLDFSARLQLVGSRGKGRKVA